MGDVGLELRGAEPSKLTVRFTDADGTTPEEVIELRDTELGAFARLRDTPTMQCEQQCVRRLREILSRAPQAWARLERHLPRERDDLMPADRLIVEASDDLALGIPIELLAPVVEGEPSRPLLATDRWHIVRLVPVASPSGEPIEREPRLLLVIGSTTQPLDRQTARPLVLDLLHEFTATPRVTIAVPVHEHRHLLAAVGEGDDQVRRLLSDERRCRVIASVGALAGILADPAVRAEVVVLLGHSIEDRGEATHFDLGLPRVGEPSGPRFAELADALAHGETRLIVAMACLMGSTATLELLRAVDHVVATGARLRAEDAARALAVLREVLLVERGSLDRVVRRMRRAFRGGLGWMLWHATRSRSNQVLADPLALALRDYLARSRDDLDRELRETLIDGRLELLVQESIRVGGDDSAAAAEFAGPRSRRPPDDDLFGSTTLRRLLETTQVDPGPCYLVVLGRPGAGKSVLLQEHALELARGEPPTRIPVFVRLRELIDESADADFVDFAVGRQTGVGSARPAMSGPTVQTLRIAVGQRRVVFLLDGLDEVPPARRDALLRRVRTLGVESQCPIVITSRPIGFVCPAGFREIWLQPLDGARQRALVTKRHGLDAPRVLAAIDARRQISPSFGHLASNPLFLTLLSDLARQGEELESQELEVLEQIIGYLVEQRNKPAGLRASLRYSRSDLVLEALRGIAMWMTVASKSVLRDVDLAAWAAGGRSSKRVPTPRELEEQLRESRDWEKGDWPDFLAEVAERTGILVSRRTGGGRNLEFRHRAFQEALCARAIITRWPKLDLNHVRALIASGPKGPADLVNYWSEPIALLAAQVADTDAWIIGLAQDAATRGIALRALASARHLSPRSIVDLVTALPDWRDRAKVYEQLVERTDRDRLAGIVAGLIRRTTNGNDLWHLRDLVSRLERAQVANAMALRPLVIAVRKPSDLSALAVVPGRHRVELWCRVEGGRLGLVGLPRCEAHVGADLIRIDMEPFLMMCVPVTLGMFRLFDQNRISAWDDDPRLPCTGLAGFEALLFCDWLNERRVELAESVPQIRDGPAGFRFRLPRECEWQAGAWRYRMESTSNRLPRRPRPVACDEANHHGMYDMLGHVGQWCYRDWIDRAEDLPYEGEVSGYGGWVWDVGETRYSASLHERSRSENHMRAKRGELGLVLRGGAFTDPESICTPTHRVVLDPDQSPIGSGLRVVFGPPLE